MKREIKKLLLKVPGFIALCRLLTRRHVRVLMYHRFIGVDDLGRINTSRAVFERQMDYVARHHAVRRATEHVASVRARRPLGGCPVVVTIDDGYRDFYDVAFPVLRDRGICATVFTATGLVDGDCWFWWDKLAYLLEQADGAEAVRPVSSYEVRFDLTSVDGRRAALNEVSNIMRWLPTERRIEEIEGLARAFGVELPAQPPAGYRGFTWEQVREMRTGGIDFAPHTVTHPILARETDDEARREIEESSRRLAEVTGEPPRIFCYPQGGPADFTPAHCRMVEAAGLEASYIAYQDVARSEDLYALPRYSSINDWDRFLWVLSGAEYLFQRFRGLFGRDLQIADEYWAGQDPQNG